MRDCPVIERGVRHVAVHTMRSWAGHWRLKSNNRLMPPKTASLVLDRIRSPAPDLASAFGFGHSRPTPISSPVLRQVLLQEPRSLEGWAVSSAVRAAGLPIDIQHCRSADAGRHVPELRGGTCMPVGSAEFVRACMQHAGISDPKWTVYPRELGGHMLQHPRRMTAASALRARKPIFVKPDQGKPFRAFVLHADRSKMTDHANVQLERLLELPPATRVWTAEALNLVSEWRYYVMNGEVIGFARFLPANSQLLPCPLLEEISTVIAAIPNDAAYALDVGVLETGETTVTAVRDAWALELVAVGDHRPDTLDYLKLLWTRWSSLILEARQRAAANSNEG